MNISQAEIATRVSIREPLVVEAQQVQDRGVQVVEVNFAVHRPVAVVVGRPLAGSLSWTVGTPRAGQWAWSGIADRSDYNRCRVRLVVDLKAAGTLRGCGRALID